MYERSSYYGELTESHQVPEKAGIARTVGPSTKPYSSMDKLTAPRTEMELEVCMVQRSITEVTTFLLLSKHANRSSQTLVSMDH